MEKPTLLLADMGLMFIKYSCFPSYSKHSYNINTNWFLWTLGNFPLRPGRRLSIHSCAVYKWTDHFSNCSYLLIRITQFN